MNKTDQYKLSGEVFLNYNYINYNLVLGNIRYKHEQSVLHKIITLLDTVRVINTINKPLSQTQLEIMYCRNNIENIIII